MKNGLNSDIQLMRHQKRRNDKIPTVSVLTGVAGLAITTWRRFAERLGRPVIQLTRPAWEDWLYHWIHHMDYQHSIPQIVVAHLAHIMDRNTEELRINLQEKTKTEINLLIEANLESAENDPENILIRIGLHSLTNPNSGWVVLENHLREEARNKISYHTLLRTLYDWAPVQGPAILLFSPAEHFNSPKALAKDAFFCAETAQCIPSCPIAWAVDQQSYQRFLEDAPESRTKALCQETVITVHSLSTDDLHKQVPHDNRLASTEMQASIHRLARDGVDQPLADLFFQAANASESQDQNQARSAAEAFLYARLESLSDTAGLFSLNQKVEIPWGEHSCMEIDLLSRQYCIAVEIDGYYHFQNPDAYRRDRRKDYGLQRAGYLVLRFLADDIVSSLEIVLDTILDCVVKRRKETTK